MNIRFLFINDNLRILAFLQGVFNQRTDTMFVQCESVEGALAAVKEYKPAVIFLDQYLAEVGDGLRVVAELRNSGNTATIYSTTLDAGAHEEYKGLGIQVIDISDLATLRQIMSN